MKTFVYDYYGYDCDIKNGEFDYKGYHFKLEKTNKTKEEVEYLNVFLDQINNLYGNVTYIVKNKYNEKITPYEDGFISLICVKKTDVDLEELLKLHLHYLFSQEISKVPLYIHDFKIKWINKINLIETKIIPSINEFDLYSIISSRYALGLSYSAIQYLEDTLIDYGDEITYLTVTHKRMSKLDSFTLFNPFNLLYDSPTRDIAELYKFNEIDEETLFQMIRKYNFGIKDIQLLFSRIMFPTYLFDILEEYYEYRDDILDKMKKYYLSINDNFNKLRKIYNYLKKMYYIRPILFFS